MRIMKLLSSMFLLGMLVVLISPNARADTEHENTYLTFSAPVELPGIVLLPGKYEFQLVSPFQMGDVVEVLDSHGNALALLDAIPDLRAHVTDKTSVILESRGPHNPEAIKAWFYPDRATGLEFIYPKKNER
jgi:hypothetical protein